MTEERRDRSSMCLNSYLENVSDVKNWSDVNKYKHAVDADDLHCRLCFQIDCFGPILCSVGVSVAFIVQPSVSNWMFWYTGLVSQYEYLRVGGISNSTARTQELLYERPRSKAWLSLEGRRAREGIYRWISFEQERGALEERGEKCREREYQLVFSLCLSL